MNYFKLLAAILMLSFISNCTQPANDTSLTNRNYDALNENNPQRDALLSEANKKKGGAICIDEDDRNHECKESCDKIYSRNRDEEECEKQTISLIEAIEDVYDDLKNPTTKKLDDMNAEDFISYINISIASLDSLISHGARGGNDNRSEKWSASETRNFLSWLLNNKEAVTGFINVDEDYGTLEAMFERILTNFSTNNIHEPFLARIQNGRFMEVAIDSGNEEVIRWIVNYIEEKSSSCKEDTVTKSCFTVYCKIGRGITKQTMEEWPEYKIFESYIINIIDDKVNSKQGTGDKQGTGWTYGDGNNKIQEFGNLNNNWVKDLCGGL